MSLLSVLGRPGTHAMELPAKIYVQVIADNMEDPSGNHFILRIAELKWPG